MEISRYAIVSTSTLLILLLALCSGEPVPGGPENMARPTRPKVFSSPDELRSYLDQLGNFYAIAGRPRFGKRNLAPWMANYAREDADIYRRLPISHTDILQMLSSANQGDD